ncbi:MAG TPA: DEAD/DEAH box helicase [Armatimonadota bacterium]|jgi:hypothetical protein
MALNPTAYTEHVIGNYLKYQLGAYAFADVDLHDQMRSLLSLQATRRTPLMKGPYISLSRAFAQGAPVADLVSEGTFHPHMAHLVEHPHLFAHQEMAVRSIAAGNSTLVSTGTGSGKTECFLYPIISRCLEMKEKGAPAGVAAVIVYPMNALAEDQLDRLRGLLAGSGIPFGLYVGSTPDSEEAVAGVRLKEGSSRADYVAAVKKVQEENRSEAVHPPEERCSRASMRTPGGQPRILLTNVKQLELLLTRYRDVELFAGAALQYLVFDEAHTFTGAGGAETACLIRRLRAFCGKGAGDTVCIATSATLASPEDGPEAGRKFAARFFGVDPSTVQLVTEQYQADNWATDRTTPPAPDEEAATLLQDVLKAVDADDAGQAVSCVYTRLTGAALPATGWREALYESLTHNELVHTLAEVLKQPQPLPELLDIVERWTKRKVSEEEVLIWLTLGAAARRDDRALLRPVVHVFVQGVSGGVVTFPKGDDHARLWLSTEQEEAQGGPDPLFRLPVLTCTTCGQHYFAHWVQDFQFADKAPGGGVAVDSRFYWPPLDESHGGRRVLLLDHLAQAEENDDEPTRTAPVFLCRTCGALHPQPLSACDACGARDEMVRLLVVQQKDARPGKLSSCVSCLARGVAFGSGFREPIRPVRAVGVADVHVLGQEMIRHAERPRLLVFADSRQDAAFQAGWMGDHARRYRLRALMWERLRQGALSVGDLVADLDDRLEADDAVSESLLPEVWQAEPKTPTGKKHQQERKYYLRLQVLREITMGPRQRVGLEPWGRLKVRYHGLSPKDEFIERHAKEMGITPEALAEGIAGILDIHRRQRLVLDPLTKVYSHFWQDGDRELQRGYLPNMQGVPQALKLERESDDNKNRLQQWLSASGSSAVRQAVTAWGVPKDHARDFLTELWGYLVQKGLLASVTLRGAKDKPVPKCSGAYQMNVDLLMLEPGAGLWRCRKCRRAYARLMPRATCPTYRCDGELVFEGESTENYDLGMLDGAFQMIRAREHSAQVPADERDELERAFKGDGDGVNTLVCTPTLELGVDIGALDAVLMRNVPPLPANYWQRAGRAGRRHRMAVDITYARPVSHDRFFFADPLKMLTGSVEPPRFNLQNEVMVRKHVHACALTRLHQMAHPGSGLDDSERGRIADTLALAFPPTIRDYLFDGGVVRPEALDVSAFTALVEKHTEALVTYVQSVFAQGWPAEDARAVTDDILRSAVQSMGADLQRVVGTLKKRLDWARSQQDRLEVQRVKHGTRTPEEDALYARCDRLVKRFKGEQRRKRAEAEGYDDTVTFGVLAAEGFLPGYGLESGSIVGNANMPPHLRNRKDFDLPRPPAVALREYVPGNLIYANGHRFVSRYYHLEPEQPMAFSVDVTNEAVEARGSAAGVTTLGAADLRAVPVCDVDLAHISNISDDEEYRFQMQVAIYGHELGRHGGGQGFTWGSRTVLFRRAVHLRLVNVGAAREVTQKGQLGYPVCTVCGQSRSPISSATELDHFRTTHLERCGRPVESTGFYADIVADSLTLKDCTDRQEAYSVLESLRAGAERVLDMERDDLQVLVIAKPGVSQVDALLYDPMPGGSGLLQQLCDRWEEVYDAAKSIVEGCPAKCKSACTECLCTYWNGYYHRHLNRIAACDVLGEWGSELKFTHDVPALLPSTPSTSEGQPVNSGEAHLRAYLARAGFPDPEWQRQIDLGHPYGNTTPDCFFPLDDEPGVCVYLDGLSAGIHGNADAQARDRELRERLREMGYEVLSIAATELFDRGAMAGKLAKLAKYLADKDLAARTKGDTTWFDEG